VRALEEQLGVSKMEGVRSMAALKDVLARIKPLVSPPVPTTDAETETVQVGAEIAFLESVNLSLNL
jgi:hypothetical protein